jgi:light-regulated signal transduction histidine kinase (bacteriophytochrome)
MQVSQDITKDFPDINLHAGLNVIAGLLHVPLSVGGKDFIAFLRKGQLREIVWAGRPHKLDTSGSLEPRSSFKVYPTL